MPRLILTDDVRDGWRGARQPRKKLADLVIDGLGDHGDAVDDWTDRDAESAAGALVGDLKAFSTLEEEGVRRYAT
jgi:hypothetical protein